MVSAVAGQAVNSQPVNRRRDPTAVRGVLSQSNNVLEGTLCDLGNVRARAMFGRGPAEACIPSHRGGPV